MEGRLGFSVETFRAMRDRQLRVVSSERTTEDGTTKMKEPLGRCHD